MTGTRMSFLLPDMGGGGAERVALTVINHFLSKGHTVDLLLMSARGNLLPLVPPQVRVIDLGAARVRNVAWPLARYLTRERPAALQISMWPLTIAGIIARRISGAPTRIIVSDHAPLSNQYAAKGVLHRLLLKWSLRSIYPRADARIVVAENAATDLAMLSGLPKAKFEVVYNPVGAPDEVEADASVDRLWGGSGFRILNVGRLSGQKNQSLLLDAVAMLPADLAVRLVILGEGPLRGDLAEHATDLGIAEKVLMPGFALDPAPYYRSADLFVLSSDYEGYPLVLIEALHFGLRVVSTDCLSGPSEILNNGEFGTLTPCRDAARLAEGIATALRAQADPQRLKDRATALSTGGADRYLALMRGH